MSGKTIIVNGTAIRQEIEKLKELSIRAEENNTKANKLVFLNSPYSEGSTAEKIRELENEIIAINTTVSKIAAFTAESLTKAVERYEERDISDAKAITEKG